MMAISYQKEQLDLIFLIQKIQKNHPQANIILSFFFYEPSFG